MAAALSIVILFTISSTIVRVAAVILEHTGIPLHIARLQALSALSGAGFTTAESELLVQTPQRRKVLAFLIITGSIGLASVIATLIGGAMGLEATAGGVLQQTLFVVLSAIVIRYVIFSQLADDIVCGFAYKWLEKQGETLRSFAVLQAFGPDAVIAEHWVREGTSKQPSIWDIDGLTVIGKRAITDSTIRPIGQADILHKGEAILLLGSNQAHFDFADAFGDPTKRFSH